MVTLQERIKTDVVNQLKWDNRIDASKVTVEVDGSKVILNGKVSTISAKNAAYFDTWNVAGVHMVDNNLDVEYSPTMEIPDDEQIKSNIETALLWNPDVDSTKVDISVTAGIVTLEGTTDAYWKKIEAKNEAESKTGVLDVINKMAVVPTESVADEVIAEDVVDAIDRNISVPAASVDVTVKDGVVTLSGTVSSWRAKMAAYDAAQFAVGVIDVKDKILVESEM